MSLKDGVVCDSLGALLMAGRKSTAEPVCDVLSDENDDEEG